MIVTVAVTTVPLSVSATFVTGTAPLMIVAVIVGVGDTPVAPGAGRALDTYEPAGTVNE